MSSNTSPLEIVEVTKRYGDLVAVDQVSFAVEGGIFGLLGANGAGKSTLFRAILDLLPIDQGTIRLGGLDSQRRGLEARRQIGYLPEELRLYDRLTGDELLAFVAGIKELDNAGERDDWLQYFGLRAARDLLIAEYSLGMRKKIALIAALMGTPKLVLLDEPLNGLDTESMKHLRLRIEAMADAGTTFVVSSHVMSFVERICHRMAILKRGKLVAHGTVDEVRAVAEMPTEPFEDVFLKLALSTTDEPAADEPAAGKPAGASKP